MIDRNSPMPLYYQLKQVLLAKIDSGELKPGDILPTEIQIQTQFAVSRTTVRQALSELETEGRVSRYRGRGTFVSKPKVRHNPEEYPSLADHMLRQGAKPGWKLLSAEWIDPMEEVSEALQLDPEDRVFCLRRLRLDGDEPIGYHKAFVAPKFVASVDESRFLDGGSLRYLRGRNNVLEDSIANRVLEAVSAGQEEANLLDVSKGAAMLCIQRLIISAEGDPVEFFRGVYRGDRFQYHINNMKAISKINA